MPRTTGSNRYTWAEFLRSITPAEYGAIMELAQSTGTTNIIRQARYTVALWQAENLVDFNEQRTVTAVTVAGVEYGRVDRRQGAGAGGVSS